MTTNPETAGVEPVALKECPFCGGAALRKPDPGRLNEMFGLVVDHKPGCFLGLRGIETDDAIDAAWDTRTHPAPASNTTSEGEHARNQELQEIADGAYGDNPMTRGLARDRNLSASAEDLIAQAKPLALPPSGEGGAATDVDREAAEWFCREILNGTDAVNGPALRAAIGALLYTHRTEALAAIRSGSDE